MSIAAGTNKIKDTKRNVLVLTLSAQNKAKLLRRLKSGEITLL